MCWGKGHTRMDEKGTKKVTKPQRPIVNYIQFQGIFLKPEASSSSVLSFSSLQCSLIFFISMYANRINLIFKIDSSIKLKKTSSGNLVQL